MLYKRLMPWLVWLTTALFFFYSFFNRVLIGSLAPHIIHTFHISTADIGLLASLLYFVLAFLQIPAGIILDRFPLKAVLGTAALLTAIGSILFALSDHYAIAIIARIITGLGSAFAFIGCLKASALWFKPAFLGFISGLTLLVGTLGALFGEGPFNWISNQIGWQHAVLGTGIFGLVLCLLIFSFVPGKPEPKKGPSTAVKSKTTFREILTSRNLLLALLSICIATPGSIFMAAWGPTYLHIAYHYSMETTTSMLSACLFGLAISAIFINLLASHERLRIPLLLTCAIVGLFSTLGFLYLPNPSEITLYLLLIVFGIVSSALMIPFTLSNQLNPEHLSATVSGFINFLTMLCGGLGQLLVGAVVQFLIQQHTSAVAAYRLTLVSIPLLFIFAIVIIVILSFKIRRHV